MIKIEIPHSSTIYKTERARYCPVCRKWAIPAIPIVPPDPDDTKPR